MQCLIFFKINNMAQTATEWLHDQLTKVWYDVKSSKELLDQAKAIEKEQIMKAVYDGMGTNFDPNMGRAEQYYNETYNK
jgi:peptidyl-tRNA hydrolase